MIRDLGCAGFVLAKSDAKWVTMPPQSSLHSDITRCLIHDHIVLQQFSLKGFDIAQDIMPHSGLSII